VGLKEFVRFVSVLTQRIKSGYKQQWYLRENPGLQIRQNSWKHLSIK